MAHRSHLRTAASILKSARITDVPRWRQKRCRANRPLSPLGRVLQYFHPKDIVHRDVTLENVLFAKNFDNEPPIKLIDFGLSICRPPQCSLLTSKVGTLGYIAPESIG
mmetsp:Transcript_32507/g.59629  ORF Transcript_32507/g.59629 Transcript_32507/m.59629 type:complete len:108 (-) Transcript_32507:1713-2036(-)|eukprot:CAMPEP_0201606080 /NCGR_PEP_ID=MMETSP0492-20130828/5666_1 /ASSEMBLY_ACC=CAM_ASM_000837 /TAXON_ID=420259 /ORGANISM="Thalassiosira gravida, Strain GMp14c1" /LENGTH=107 /DNA_ID=CAMNT_0048070427 /DNA_START=1327 /DNA_END=1650 /DNA_ORIENTATION=+